MVAIVSLIITNMYYIPASAKWINDSKSNWNWVEGEVKTTGWKQIDKKWYYFNEDGIMSTSWLKYNEKWYNLSTSGVMETGWKNVDGKWYHFNTDGVMSIGWINDNGTWYYTNFSGEMETGTICIDGVVYTFLDSGAMADNNKTIQEVQQGTGSVNNVKSDESGKDKEIDKSDSNVRTAYVCTNDDSLNVRLEASISSNIIGSLIKGTEVKIIDGEKDGFYHIRANGIDGFASSQWISFEKPAAGEVKTSLESNSKENNITIDDKNVKIENELKKGEIRDKEPSLDDKHYYSDMNLFYKVKLSPPFSSGGKLIKGNCTWYAWGRAWEITGSQPSDAGFKGNAYEWWEANKKSGKYQYGSEPRVGAIAVWKSDLPNSSDCGHVAVVEKIDGNKIYISESMWHGVTFKYREIYETSYLYGYIYLDKPNY